MKVVSKIAQVVLDVVVGMATYYICTTLSLSATVSMGITLAVAAVFAEFCEVKMK